jgi:hypothetical protein
MANSETAMQLKVGDKVYDFDADHVSNTEAMAIELACHCTFMQWTQNVEAGSALALTALVWLVQRRENPGLKFQDVRFDIGDVEWVTPEDEDDKPAEAKPSAEPVYSPPDDVVNPTSDEVPTANDGSTT